MDRLTSTRVHCTVAKLRERYPSLSLQRARQKRGILIAALRAQTRGDARKYSVWTRRNAEFDIRHLR